MEGSSPVDRLYRADVRWDGKTDLFGNGCLVQATDCFVSEPITGSDADQLEKILLIFY